MNDPDLARIPLFKRLSPAAREKIRSLMTRKRFRAQTAVFFQDDPSDSLYVLLTGSAKVFRTSEDGRDHVLSTIRPGDLFGELAMIEGLPRSATVQTVEDSEMLWLSRPDFEGFARGHPEVLWTLLQALCERVRHADQELDLLLQDVPYRLLYRLSQLVEAYGESGPDGWRLRIPLSVGELARRVGSNPETISRLIETWERDGLLRRAGETWILPDRKALSRALEYAASAP